MTFFKRAAFAALALCLCFALAACSGLQDAAGGLQEAGSQLAEQVGQLLRGDVTGKVGETYRTEWFNFSISSIKQVESYAGYAPEEGNLLYDVVITELSTFDEAIPMGTFDFFMLMDGTEEPVFPMDPLNGDETMMPAEFDLSPDESVTYHMVYEVPKDAKGLKLMYIELYENSEEQGTTFTIPIS
ncbi:MAG: hypothetical protein LBU47_07725 [Christensenellaceae bacterium]|jgi:hypothetical protein|nr:hypothetical protein [Christensenellaceae bacterium]